jgi:hypothetical protein
MLAGTVAAFLLASAAPTAADFWEEKEFTTWSPQQVEKMLTDSPWAKKATIVLGTLREQSAGDGFQSGGAGFGGGGGGPARDPGDGEFQGVRRITATVAWVSAPPIRQAVARRRIGLDAPIMPDQQRELLEAEPSYVVAVVGLPLRVVQGGTIEEVRDRTALKPARKAPIKPEDIRVFPDGDQSVRVEFVFPKTDAITLDDKDVEFVTKMGAADITKKFRLADMTVRGRLAL